jgi:hypothetical protein
LAVVLFKFFAVALIFVFVFVSGLSEFKSDGPPDVRLYHLLGLGHLHTLVYTMPRKAAFFFRQAASIFV